MIRFLLKHTVNYTLAGQVPMFANLLLYPIISEHLTSFDYFVYGTALGYLGIVNMVSDLGMTALFQNAFFKKGAKYTLYWAHYLGFMILYRVAFSGAAIGIVWFALHDEVNDQRLWWAIALLVIPLLLFELPQNIGMRLMQFQHRHHLVTRFSFASGILAVATSFVTIYVLRLGFMGFFISSFVTSVFLGIAYGWQLFIRTGVAPQFRQKGRRIKEWMKVALPLLPHQFTTYLLNSSDRVVLDRNLGNANVTTATVGMFNVAYSFANYFNFFNNQLNTILSPIYFSLFRDRPEESAGIIRRVTFLWIWALIFVCVLAGTWSKELFGFFFINNTDNLAASYKYVIFIFFSFCFRPFYLVSVDFVIFHEKTTSLFKITTVGALLNLVLNIALIPLFGVEVAVYTTYLSFAYIGISGHLFRNTSAHITKKYNTFGYFILITCIGIGVTYTVEWPVVAKLLLTGSALSAAGLWFYRFGGREQVAELNRIRIQ